MSQMQTHYQKFASFGKYIYYMGIAYIASIIIPFAGIAMLILAILAIQELKDVKESLNNANLESFYSKYLTAQILNVVGSLISTIGGLAVQGSMMDLLYGGGYPDMGDLLMLMAPTLISFIFVICGAILEYIAWGALQQFFTSNREMFPEGIGADAADGAGKLRSGALMILLFFLLITLLIGFIYYLIGYFNLGDALKKLDNPNIAAPHQASWSSGPTVADSGQSITTPPKDDQKPKFCRKCGSALEPGIQFCPACGVKVTDGYE